MAAAGCIPAMCMSLVGHWRRDDTEEQKTAPNVERNTVFSDAFLKAIPKTDLHLHLDGSLRLQTLIDLAQEQGVELPAYTEEGMREKVFKPSYANLEEYLEGFIYTSAVLRKGYALERVAYELAIDNFAEGALYIEVRFAPQLHVVPGSDPADGVNDVRSVIGAVNRGLEKAQREINDKRDPSCPPFHYGIIVCAMRMFDENFSPYYADLCQQSATQNKSFQEITSMASLLLVQSALQCRDEGLPVVALDIAGAENGYQAQWHRDAYAYAHKSFLHKTVHAGEGFGPESIFQAITDLHAERIGHGFHLFSDDMITSPKVLSKGDLMKRKYVEQLVQYLGDRRILLEVCLTSNLGTMPELQHDLKRHNIVKMFRNRIAVSLCTDNRLVSDTCLCKEYRLAVDTYAEYLPPSRLRDMVIAGFKRSFFPGTYLQKRQYVHDIIEYYDKVAKQHGVTEPEHE